MNSQPSRILSAFQALRIRDWWSYLLPPVMAIGYLGLLARATPLDHTDVVALGSLLLSSVGMAAFGFFLNQWTDREEDALAGKANSSAQLSPVQAYSVLALTAGLALLPWAFHPLQPLQGWLLALQFCALMLYHLPPVRAKNRLLPAVLLDSSYSSVFYPLLAWSLFQELAMPSTALLVGWCVARGLRNIALHMIQDRAADARAGRRTLVHRLDSDALKRAILWVLFPAETVMGLLWMHSQSLPAFLLFVYALWTTGVILCGLLPQLRFKVVASLNHAWEILLPYTAIVLLALAQPTPQPWLLVHALFFPRPFVHSFRKFRERISRRQVPP